jgi:hypothetical protein
LAKHIYQLLPLEQHHKIEKNKKSTIICSLEKKERESERDEKITRAKTIKKQKELRKQMEKSEGRKQWAPNPKRCRETLNIMKKLVCRSPPLAPSYGSEFANRCLSFSFFSAAHSLVSLFEVCCLLRHP